MKLTDGTIWKQEEYHYEYRYAYRPEVTISSGLPQRMQVKGMRKAVRVRQLT